MFIGSASGHANGYAPLSGKGEAAVASPSSPAGAVVSSEAAPFINPAVNFDYKAGIAVFQIRDGETGEVKAQYPSQKVVEEYIRHGGASKEASAPEAQATPAQQGQPSADPALAAAAAAGQAAPAPAPTPAPAPASAPSAPVVHSADQVA